MNISDPDIIGFDINLILNSPKPDLNSIPITDWYDNSRFEQFSACNRLSWYQDILQLDQSSAPMAAGTVFHKGIEELAKGKSVDQAGVDLVREWEQYKHLFQPESARFQRQNMYDVYLAYTERWKNEPFTYLALEVPLAWYIDYGLFYWLIGKCDGIVWWQGKLWLIERKTTGALRPDFLGGLNQGTQKFQYLYILYKILEKAGYNPQEILGGLIFDCIGWSATKTEFARWPVLLPNKAQFAEWLSEVERNVARIRQSYSDANLVLPIKRRRQCFTYGKCAFLDLCTAYEVQSGTQTPAIVANFRKRTWRPI